MRSSATALALAVTLMAGAAWAAPKAGDRFPPIESEDLSGRVHTTTELVGRRALVIAITDRDAANAMGAWYDVADNRMPAAVARESLVSLHLPFFVSTGLARSKAREQVPERFWSATLLDRGDMASALGLAHDKLPYVFAIDETGHVLAAVHGAVDSPRAEEIWRSLAGASGEPR